MLGGLKIFIICPECQIVIDKKIDQFLETTRQLKLDFDSWVKEHQRYWKSKRRQIELPDV
jgi:hypothetical protein